MERVRPELVLDLNGMDLNGVIVPTAHVVKILLLQQQNQSPVKQRKNVWRRMERVRPELVAAPNGRDLNGVVVPTAHVVKLLQYQNQ